MDWLEKNVHLSEMCSGVPEGRHNVPTAEAVENCGEENQKTPKGWHKELSHMVSPFRNLSGDQL